MTRRAPARAFARSAAGTVPLRNLANGTMDARDTFDTIATLYDAARPDYPPALFEDLAEIAGLAPSDAVLEIGCGTGLATQGLARWSNAITALDPGGELLRVAQRRLAAFPPIELIQSTFEAWPPRRDAFRLVVAAQSFHWLAPAERFAKIASVLEPDGVLAVFGNVPILPSTALGGEIEQAYQRHAPALVGLPPEGWYLPDGPLPGLFAASAHFGSARHRRYAWTRVHTAASFADFRCSQSSHQLLPAPQRAALLDDVAAAIERAGGSIEIGYESHLYTATRAA